MSSVLACQKKPHNLFSINNVHKSAIELFLKKDVYLLVGKEAPTLMITEN